MKFSTDHCRQTSVKKLGFHHTVEAIAKMSGFDRRGFPPKCVKCVCRDAKMCMKHNETCYKTKEILCFKKQYRRQVHEDYVKK